MRTKMPLGIRILLGAVSFLLCVALFVTTIATAVLGDLSVVFQKDNLKNLLTEVMFSSAVRRIGPGQGTTGSGHGAPAAHRVPLRLEETSPSTGEEAKNTSAMVEWIYDSLQNQFQGSELPSLDEVQKFVDESTVSDFLADKTASLISDLYTGENTTTITNEEIQTLLEENAELIENTFNIPMSSDVIAQIVTEVEKVEVVQKIQKEGVNAVVNDMISGGALSLPGVAPAPDGGADGSGTGGQVGIPGTNGCTGNPAMDTLNALRSVTKTSTLLLLVGVCVVLVGLLIVTNLKRIWLGLIDSGITLTLAGGLLSIPTVMVFFAEESLRGLLSSLPVNSPLPIAPAAIFLLKLTGGIHFGILAGGIALLAGSIVLWAVLRRKFQAVAVTAEPAESPVPDMEPLVVAPSEEPAEEAAAEAPVQAEEVEETEEIPEEATEAPAEETADPV